jgi:hypothetical protein
MDTIIRAPENEILGASLACVRINRSEDIRHSHPCPECMRMMRYYGIVYIVYSTQNGIEKEFLRTKQ